MSEDWIYKCSVCGHEIRVNYAYRDNLPTKCDNCGAKTKQFYKTAEDAAESWNRRMSDETA